MNEKDFFPRTAKIDVRTLASSININSDFILHQNLKITPLTMLA
jgi:hypothetical protein